MIRKLTVERVHGLDYASVDELVSPCQAMLEFDRMLEEEDDTEARHFLRMARSGKPQWSSVHSCHVNGLNEKEYSLYRSMEVKQGKPVTALFCHY